MAFIFPWTNLHDVNLDWLIEQVKKIPAMIPTRTSQLTNDSGYITQAQTAPVQSVNGQTGAVVLDAADVGAKPASYSAPVDSVNGQTGAVVLDAAAVGAKPASYSAPVDSVNGQTGTVVLDAAAVGAKPASYSAPVDSVNGATGSVSVADLTYIQDGTSISAYPTTTGLFVTTSNRFANLTASSYYGVLTIIRKGSYQRHAFSNADGQVFVGWSNAATITEPATWKRVDNTVSSAWDILAREEFEVNANVSAGTIGSRAELVTTNCAKTGYEIIDAWITYVNGSANATFSLFQQANTQNIYCAIYRATSAAFTCGCKFSVLYAKI